MKDRDRQTNYLQIYSEEFQNSRKNLLLCAVCYRPELDQTTCPKYFLSLILTGMAVVADVLKGKVLEQQQFHNDLIPSKYL